MSVYRQRSANYVLKLFGKIKSCLVLVAVGRKQREQLITLNSSQTTKERGGTIQHHAAL